MERDMKLS